MQIKVRENINLAEYTTFNIGGKASHFVSVRGEDELRQAFAYAGEKQLKFCILAGGSNILFSDDGFDGLVINIIGDAVTFYNGRVIADAGASLTGTIRKSGGTGLTGWESMCGIPGSVGGAVRGNAGAFGTEIKDVLGKVRAMNIKTGEVRDFNNKECEFEYRSSYFKTHPEWVVLTTVFNLEAGLPSGVNLEVGPLKKCDEIIKEREGRHLQDVACAGSFFKNPICSKHPEVIRQFEEDKGVKSNGGKVPAGWLIDKCGLKGTTIGGAVCSKQHPNYLINSGCATAEDVLKLGDLIKDKVKEKFGINLEEEVTIIK